MEIFKVLSEFIEEVPVILTLKIKDIFWGETDELTKFRNTRWKNAHKKMEKTTVKIFIDLNGLKSINEMKNYAAGDEFIKNFARKTSSFCKQYGFTPIRLHGDEFLLVSKRPLTGWLKAIEALRESVKNETPFSYGTGVTTEEAEEEMKADKTEQYRLQGIDRRTDPRRCFDKVIMDKFGAFAFEEKKASSF